jgi:hypothetical protein
MSLSECMAESRTRYEKAAEIEGRHPNGVTPDAAADFAEVKRLLGEIDLIETRSRARGCGARTRRIQDNTKRLNTPAQRHQQPQDDIETRGGAPASFEMFGAEFVESAEVQADRRVGRAAQPARGLSSASSSRGRCCRR